MTERDQKSLGGPPGHLYGVRGGTFLGCVFSHEFHFVCDFTIQILYWGMLLCTIYTPSSMRATLPRRLVGRSVSTRDRARARAGSNPAVCNFQPSEWSVLISD